MSIVKQLYQLQEVDLELEVNQRLLKQITSQLGESEALISARNQLRAEQKHLEELRHQQHSIEWSVDDIQSKISAIEKELYGGRTRNPKELINLEQEAKRLKTKLKQLEDEELETMEQIELATSRVAISSDELKKQESEWQAQQQQLSTEQEKVTTIVADLQNKWQRLAAEIDSNMIELYNTLKKQRKTAIAKVEQGICRGCLISLPVRELQQAKSGNLVRCGSCGRILFLA